MKVRSRIATISAAVAALMYGGARVSATDLTWDNDPGTPGVQDGSGNWDTASTTWFDGTNNVAWSNTPGDNATFGDTTSTFVGTATPNNIDLAAPITVQNMTLGIGTNGAIYNFSDFGGGSLTVTGNINKTANNGALQFLLVSGPMTLAAGSHTFAMNDTPGDTAELAVNGSITGAGGVTVDNGLGAYQTWGTLAFNANNDYTGVTNVNNGRLVITTSGGLGSDTAGTTIGSLGTVSIGGAGTTVVGGLNITEPITITRNTYSGGEFDRYKAALIFNNNGGAQTHTISGPFVVDSTDARVQVNTNTLNITSNITEGTTVAPGTGVLTLDGDFAGFVNLTGNNTGIAGGGIKLIGGVELNVTNDNNLGGPTAPLQFAGSATLHPVGGWMTNFGAHPINNASFSGGIDVDAGQTFTIDQSLGTTATAVGSLGKRGTGTLNLNASINLRGGQTFFDGGIVNVNSDVTLHSLHLRSPVVNIGTGGSITTSVGFNSLGQDSTGTNGGPDKAIVNITGNGQLIQTNNVDFNLSDNANTEGTISLSDSGVLTVGGLMHVGKSNGGKGTIVQNGGTFTLTRNGNFTLVLGSRAGTGTYNLNAGTMTSAGEFYVGQGNGAVSFGTGIFNMTGGTVNQNNWFVVGREGGVGTVDISGGTFNHAGGNMSIGESNKDNVMTLRNNAHFVSTSGEFWVANNGGNKASLTVQDSATLSVTDWFVVGRFGAIGTLNVSGGSITKSGGGNTELAVNGGGVANVTISGTGSYTAQTGDFRLGQGGGSNGTLLLKDSGSIVVSAGETWIANGGGTGTFTQQGGSITGNNWMAIGRGGGSTGVVNMSGGTWTKQGGNFLAIGSGGSGTFNQSGGILNSNNTYLGEASNGTANLSGGTANFTGAFSLGQNGGVFGTLNISNTAIVTVPDVKFGNNGGTGGGTLNLDGGTLTGGSFTNGAGTGAKIFNFNGGTLKVAADSATFMQGLTAANVKNGGAIIDSNGHSATMTQGLVANGTGGLTKNGLGSLTVGGANTYTGATTVNAGTLNIDQSSRTSSALVVANGATARLTPRTAGVKTLQVGTLNLNSTGTLDLTSNDLVVDNGSYTTIKNAVLSGFGSTGPGIVSSTSDGSQILALFDNALIGAGDWNGGTIGANAVVGKYTYFGDVNFDGQVTGDDYTIIDSNLNTTPPVGFEWLSGDANLDGIVTGDDYTTIDSNLGLGVGNPLAASSVGDGLRASSLSAVPEPASLGLVAMAGVMFCSRRRRRVTSV